MILQRRSALSAGNAQRRGRQQRGANVCPDYTTAPCDCQHLTERSAIPLQNAASLLDGDPTPEAVGWAADLLDLALDALSKAGRAELLATCCRVAGDLAGWEYWRRRMLAHQSVAWAATHPKPGRSRVMTP